MSHDKQLITGQSLIADYQNAFVSASTIAAAQHEATRSENELISQLESISAGSYLNPSAMLSSGQDEVSRASLDAHIKKVQAQQLSEMSAFQLQTLTEEDQKRYHGRKVKVTVKQSDNQPVEIMWFDQQNGYRTSVGRKKTFSGTVENVLLDRNVLLIKPSLANRLMNSRLQNYIVYIVDPATFMPMVDVTIL